MNNNLTNNPSCNNSEFVLVALAVFGIVTAIMMSKKVSKTQSEISNLDINQIEGNVTESSVTDSVNSDIISPDFSLSHYTNGTSLISDLTTVPENLRYLDTLFACKAHLFERKFIDVSKIDLEIGQFVETINSIASISLEAKLEIIGIFSDAIPFLAAPMVFIKSIEVFKTLINDTEIISKVNKYEESRARVVRLYRLFGPLGVSVKKIDFMFMNPNSPTTMAAIKEQQNEVADKLKKTTQLRGNL